MGYLKAVVLFLALIFFGLVAFILSVLVLIVSPVFPRLRFKLNQFFLKPFAFFTRSFLGIRQIVLHEERTKLFRPCLLVGNHQSGLDLAIIGSVCTEGTVIVGKREIQNIPIFGWFFKIAGNLLIDRSKTTDAKRQMDRIRHEMQDRNLNMAIFPEGTRSRTQTILPFKKGAFHFAVSTGFPLVPVVCSSLKGRAAWESFGLNGGHVIISVLEPIETKGLTLEQIDVLRDRVRQQMKDEFDRISALADQYDRGEAVPSS